MALPDNIEISQGTEIVFGESGATGVTHTLSLNALANGAARMSAGADLGADYADEYIVIVQAETGTAPAAGNTVDLYLLGSYDNTNWPAKVTGSDGAYTLGTGDAHLRQAGAPVCVLVATDDGNTVLTQAPVIWRPRGRYVVALIDNNLGQALRNATTATDHESRVILVPRKVRVTE